MKVTDTQKKFTTYGVLGGMLLGIGTKKNTPIILLYAVTFGIAGFYLGNYIGDKK